MKRMLLGLSVFFAVLFGLVMGTIVGESVQADTGWEDIWMNNGIEWPVGVALDAPINRNEYKPINGMFTTDGSNSSFIQGTGSYQLGAQLTGAQKKNAVIRSTSNNRFDLSKPFRVETMILMDGTLPAADGIAFFMTGDLNQSMISGDGEQIGVWGRWTAITTGTAVSSAMKKSFAIVLDPYIKPIERGGSIDEQLSAPGNDDYLQAIVHGYPNENQTYTKCDNHSHRVLDFKSNAVNAPKYKIRDDLVSPKWKSFTVDYKVENGTGTLSYYYEEELINSVTWTNSERISRFGTNQIVNWGFTGTTGDKAITSAVTFRKVTGTVNAKANLTARDSKGDELNENSTLKVGERLNQELTIDYSGASRQNWYMYSGFEVELRLGSNYRFRPNENDEYIITIDKRDYEATKDNDQMIRVKLNPSEVSTNGVVGTDKDWEITTLIEAIAHDSSQNQVVGTLTGDSGTIVQEMNLPMPRDFRLKSVPNLSFQPVTMAQVFKGVDTPLINLNSAVVSAVNNYPNQGMRLRAEMNTFVLNKKYKSGGVQISFKTGANENPIILADDSKTVTISENMGTQNTDINLQLTDVNLHIDPSFDISAGDYKAAITWTIEQTP